MSETKPERNQNSVDIETLVKKSQRLIDETRDIISSINESVFITSERLAEQRKTLSKDWKKSKI